MYASQIQYMYGCFRVVQFFQLVSCFVSVEHGIADASLDFGHAQLGGFRAPLQFLKHLAANGFAVIGGTQGFVGKIQNAQRLIGIIALFQLVFGFFVVERRVFTAILYGLATLERGLIRISYKLLATVLDGLDVVVDRVRVGLLVLLKSRQKRFSPLVPRPKRSLPRLAR